MFIRKYKAILNRKSNIANKISNLEQVKWVIAKIPKTIMI